MKTTGQMLDEIEATGWRLTRVETAERDDTGERSAMVEFTGPETHRWTFHSVRSALACAHGYLTRLETPELSAPAVPGE
jgi:hypothetical protein